MAFALLLAATAWPQAPVPVEENSISVQLGTKFLTAYRDTAWIPVDVFVRNNKKDIKGYVELRTYSPVGPQTPVYRVPAESPKGSSKRFRVYCRFSGTTELAAMLLNGERPAVDIPSRISNPTPVGVDDVLCLVLDNDSSSYSFLHRAVSLADETKGFYREALGEAELALLPEHPQCYEAYDAVIIGDIDSSRMTTNQRELLLAYARAGGTLVVCTGKNTDKHRGTWLEEACGVAFGEEEALNELDIATGVFSEGRLEGARDRWQASFTTLTPVDPSVKTCGKTRVLATMRPMGAGRVVALAVDVESKTIEKCRPYMELWRDICKGRGSEGHLRFDNACARASGDIWRGAGIRLFPRSSVIKYLAAYILVAVVGNWLFWSFLKRREMAWVCLMFFSAAFTVYAAVVGGAGRAKANSLRELQLLHVPAHGAEARLQSAVALITARTSRFDFRPTHDSSLISDITEEMRFGIQQQGRRLAFTVTQGAAGGIRDFVCGASELRMFKVDTRIPLSGAFEGALTLNEDKMSGELLNATGLELENPFLLYEGALLGLNMDGNRLTINKHILPDESERHNPYGVVERFTRIQGHEPYGFASGFAHGLLTDHNTGVILNSTTPLLCAWVRAPGFPTVETEGTLLDSKRVMLVTAEVELKREDGMAFTKRELSLGSLSDMTFLAMRSDDFSKGVGFPAQLPDDVPVEAVEEVVVTARFEDNQWAECISLFLRPGSSERVRLSKGEQSSTYSQGRTALSKVYRIDSKTIATHGAGGFLALELRIDPETMRARDADVATPDIEEIRKLHSDYWMAQAQARRQNARIADLVPPALSDDELVNWWLMTHVYNRGEGGRMSYDVQAQALISANRFSSGGEPIWR